MALVLTQAVLPKEGWLSDRQLDLSWLAAGFPEALHLENAAEFKAEARERGTRVYGVRLLYRPPGRPHLRPFRRVLGRLEGSRHKGGKLPGSDPHLNAGDPGRRTSRGLVLVSFTADVMRASPDQSSL